MLAATHLLAPTSFLSCSRWWEEEKSWYDIYYYKLNEYTPCVNFSRNSPQVRQSWKMEVTLFHLNKSKSETKISFNLSQSTIILSYNFVYLLTCPAELHWCDCGPWQLLCSLCQYKAPFWASPCWRDITTSTSLWTVQWRIQSCKVWAGYGASCTSSGCKS